MDAIGKRQPVPHRLKCKYRLRSVGFSKEKLYDLTRKLEEEITFINNSSSETSDNIGVINIHNKIRLYEGNNYGLSINNIPNHTSVTLHLNAKQQTTT